MKAWKWLGLAALVAAGLFVVAVATRPERYRVERSVTVDAPAAAVLPYLADLRAWRAWSPWEKVDPEMTRSYGGASYGVGATYAWRGNAEIGAGGMTIVELTPERVAIRLDFQEPIASTSLATFALERAGEGTRVTWAMDGTNGFVGKAISLFLDMDAMIGASFASGLSDLKSQVEKAAAAAPA